ncbi:hypothetical protein GJ496_001237 [Pomphorhynchus laevis]|nr:hypothetical protein GJ496_001237 [Pomphorhynchus laevis]
MFLNAESLGAIVAVLHRNEIVHGDLTTSNFLVVNNDPQNIYTIYFGLSQISNNPEYFAVDLYVLERALFSCNATSQVSSPLFAKLMDTYTRCMGSFADRILYRLEEVRSRGRKRTMLG